MTLLRESFIQCSHFDPTTPKVFELTLRRKHAGCGAIYESQVQVCVERVGVRSGRVRNNADHLRLNMACTWRIAGITTTASLLLLGSIFLVIGFVFRNSYQPYGNGVQTKGRITGFVESKGKSGYLFAEIFTFETEDGETIEKTSRCQGSNYPQVGATVRVSYRPPDPDGARNLDSACSRAATVVFLVLGGVCLVLSLCSMVATILFASCSKAPQLDSDQVPREAIHEPDEEAVIAADAM